MKTSQPISTIAYNTLDYFLAKLDEAREGNLVQEYACILHWPEDDEAGNKLHIHTYILPGRPVDMTLFRDFFKEPDPDGNPIPLRPLPFHRVNSFKDWYLYVLHDPVYLASKLQSRKYQYERSDIITSDPNWFHYMCHEAMVSQEKDTLAEKLHKAIVLGFTWNDVLARGFVKPHEVLGGKEIWNALLKSAKGETFRNGRPGHEGDDVTTDDLLPEDVKSKRFFTDESEPQYDPSKVVQLSIDDDTPPLDPEA